MPTNNWQRVEEIFGQALELPPAERPRYLARACGDDARLREQVEYLLKCDEEAGDFIAAPAVDVRQGLTTIEETAEVLGIGTATVIRQWRMARASLYRQISADALTGDAPAGG